MPIDELERHPYIDYLDNKLEAGRKYTGLIVGSFPVYSCTDTLDNNLQVVTQRFTPEDVTMRFFYSSKKSKFWEYCARALDEPNPTLPLAGDEQNNFHDIAKQRTIEFLNRNNLLITDVIRTTNRNKKGDEDSNLWIVKNAPRFIVENLEKNLRIREIIEQHQFIRNLFFTATGTNGKSPFGWFSEIFGKNMATYQSRTIGNRLWGIVCDINGRQINAFLLPTPKPRGIHFSDNQRVPMFVNYLKSVDPIFYKQIKDVSEAQRTTYQKQKLKELRYIFLIETYRQAFVKKNLDFDGHV